MTTNDAYRAARAKLEDSLRATVVTVYNVPGEVADEAGGLMLQEVANEKQVPLFVEGGQFHKGRLYMPEPQVAA